MSKETTTQVLSLVSGKGGSGKTALAIGAARMLALLGYKTLLVDFDFKTHGLSYFFEGFAKKQSGRGFLDMASSLTEPSFLGLLSPVAQQAREDFKAKVQRHDLRVHIDEWLDVLLSRVKFKVPGRTERPSDNEFLVSTFAATIEQHRGVYSYIIIDNEAGPSGSVSCALRMSDRSVVVAEPDSISIAAARNFEYALSEDLTEHKSFLLNKVFPEESSNVEAISDYLRLFDHLTPVPFDFEVRRLFSLKQLPFDSKIPTVYGVSIIRFLQETFPELAHELKARAEQEYAEHYGKLEAQRRRALRDMRFGKGIRVGFMAAFAVVVGSTFYFVSQSFKSGFSAGLKADQMLAMMFTLIVAALFGFLWQMPGFGRSVRELRAEIKKIESLLQLRERPH